MNNMQKSAYNKIKKSFWCLRKTAKWLVVIVFSLLLLIAGVIYYVYNYADWQKSVRDLVHQQGSAVTGTDVNISGINLSLQNGSGSVSGITVANPQGYSQKYIIQLADINVAVNKNSITKIIKELAQKNGSRIKTIVIDEIKIQKPEVTYELLNLKQTNAADLLNNIKRNTASAAPKETTAEKDVEAYVYKVAIKKVVIADGMAKVAANLLGASGSLSLNLPTITINDLGTEKQGITIEDGLARIFQELLKTTTDVVAKADLSSLLGSAGNLINGVADTAGNTAKSLTSNAGKAAGAVTDGVKDVTESIGSIFK